MTLGGFQPLADLLPEPMLLLRPDGTIQDVNRAFTSAFGWRREETAGASLIDFVTTPREDLSEFLRHCAATSGLLFGGVTLRHRDGTETPWRAEGASLRTDAGRREHRVYLRLVRKDSAIARFVDLTRQLGDLSAEVVRRRDAERAAAEALDRERRLRDRLSVLAEASRALVASLALEDVLAAIGRLAVRLLPADAHAVWHADSGGHQWRAAWHEGLSEAFTSAIINWDGTLPPVEPLFVEDVDQVPMLEGRRATYAAAGIQALIIMPLQVEGKACGTVVSYYRRPISITDDDRRVAVALGNLASSALGTTTLYEAESASRLAAQSAASRAAFLARASSILANSLDYEATLKAVAQLAVPDIGDWCAVDIATGKGELKRLAVAHVDPAKVQLAIALEERYPTDPASPFGAAHALRTQRSILLSQIPDELLVASVRDADHLALIRGLGLTSYMCVPLVTRGRAIGVLTFVSAESRREYGAADLQLAEDLAARAALAVENARAYEEVRRTSRVKDEFLATLSHELRTPLNAVLGYARMIRAGALPPDKQGRALEVLERNATSLTQIVEDILDVSRIVAGKIRLNVHPVDLSVVLGEAVETVRPAADAKGVHLETSLTTGVPQVAADPDRLQQVLWNVLSNAVKFTPRGGRVTLQLGQVGSHVEVIVSDSGVGIGSDFLPHLFEPFRQADSGFSRQHGGLGLGLAIARHIVEMHGGQISAASEGEGRGATLRVRLPVTAVRQQVPGDGSTTPVPIESREAERLDNRLDGIRVLVVDDDADARMLITDVLQAAGAHVTTAASASAALRQLQDAGAEVPHVLLTDVGMPGMDGLEMVEIIRRSEQPFLRALPTIALTAYARSEDRMRVLQSGAQMHVAKPISPAELLAAIRSLIGTAGHTT